jgi:predicted nucleotidyltransferase
LQFLDDPLWQERLLGVLHYGSQATGEGGPNSDIDLCIVALQAADQ